MIIMGIDPGIASTGYGLIKTAGSEKAVLLDYGVITTSAKTEHHRRLQSIYRHIEEIIANNKPDVVAVEIIFHSKNLKSLADVSEAIGVITLAAANFNIAIEKFTPLKVKSSVVGFGKAGKDQVQLMVMNILNLDETPMPHHAADALAVAICYRNLFC